LANYSAAQKIFQRFRGLISAVSGDTHPPPAGKPPKRVKGGKFRENYRAEITIEKILNIFADKFAPGYN